MMPYEKKDTILRVENVGLQYGDKIILRDVDAEVRNIVRPGCSQGQVICFLGPSGVGKTQLSRIIAGLNQPTSGRVLVGPQLEPVRKGMVGMVPQNYPLFEYATVADNLTIAGRQAGLAKGQIEEKGLALLNAFDLWSYRHYYPRHLSGGTRQRVAIIRQLICSDHYLIMDEPFSGLDLINKQRACELITKVSMLDELNTIIIVTHDVTEGMSVADTVWLMGYEQTPTGAYLPGARLIEEYDLAAADLCWHPDILVNPRFIEFVAQVKTRFRTLKPVLV
jgi:ABC-type nitrate/sulfonate/bicarbonate transport system ATPase subunit